MSFYDHYTTMEVSRVGRQIMLRSARRMQREIGEHMRGTDVDILEIGPGAGVLARQLIEAGYSRYTAVEPNDRLRGRLEELGLTVHDYMIPELQEPDASKDVIVLSHVFEHLNGTSEARLFVSEAVRVLRPGGLLCIVSPDYLHFGVEFFNGDYTHSNVTTVRRTVQLFEDHGLRTVRVRHFSGPFSGPLATLISMGVRVFLWPVRGETNDSRWYRLKTTFLRSFLVIGQKPRAGSERRPAATSPSEDREE